MLLLDLIRLFEKKPPLLHGGVEPVASAVARVSMSYELRPTRRAIYVESALPLSVSRITLTSTALKGCVLAVKSPVVGSKLPTRISPDWIASGFPVCSRFSSAISRPA